MHRARVKTQRRKEENTALGAFVSLPVSPRPIGTPPLRAASLRKWFIGELHNATPHAKPGCFANKPVPAVLHGRPLPRSHGRAGGESPLEF